MNVGGTLFCGFVEVENFFVSTQKLLRVTMVKARAVLCSAVLSCAVMQTSDCDKIVTGATLLPPRPAPPRLSDLIQVDTCLASPGLMSHYITRVRGKNTAKVTRISVHYFISN